MSNQQAQHDPLIDHRLPPFTVEPCSVPLSETLDWSIKDLGIEAAWSKSTGKGVKVAVLDTGIDRAHLESGDLTGAVAAAKNFTSSQNGFYDVQGHGTHCAGTIGARKNGKGVVGPAYDCRLLIAKVLGDSGSGSGSGIAAGIDWAVAQGAEIVSMSLGSPQADNTIYAAIKRATAKGVHVVCAAGNSGSVPGRNTIGYPARFRETMAIGAYRKDGQIADFSSRGPEIDLAAPGQQILSTYLRGGYANLSGTSMATPCVAAIMAMVIAFRRDRQLKPLSPAEMIRFFQDTATDVGPPGHDHTWGYGKPTMSKLLAGGVQPGSGVPAGAVKLGPFVLSLQTIDGKMGLFTTWSL